MALLDGGRATTTAPPRVNSGARATPASREVGSPEQRAHVSLAAERGDIRPPEPLPSDAISDAQIMRLLEAELAADADPAAADALLRSLGEALHAPQSEP